MNSIRKIREKLTIWAIHHFRLKLPDLIREERPRPGKIYYYYGRWIKLVQHDAVTRRKVADFCDQQNMNLLDISDDALIRCGQIDQKIKLQNSLHDLICTGCPLNLIGLPCKKVYLSQSRKSDLCLTHRYVIIKGKEYGEEILSRRP